MKRMIFSLSLLLLLLPLISIAQDNARPRQRPQQPEQQRDNRLSRQERRDGWQLLFNGENYDGWKNNNGKPIASQVEDGCMQTFKCGGYILTYDKEFANFIIVCDVKMDDECNSGIFLRMEDIADPVNTGFEIQVHTSKPDEKPTVNSVGSLYDIKAPTKNASKGAGQWDHYEIKFVGKKISIKLNEEEVTVADLDDYKEPGKRDIDGNHKYVKDGKPRALADFATKGYIGFQDHDHKVWIKNIKILELDENGETVRPVRENTGRPQGRN